MLSCEPLETFRHVDDVLLILDGKHNSGELLTKVALHQLIGNSHTNNYQILANGCLGTVEEHAYSDSRGLGQQEVTLFRRLAQVGYRDNVDGISC